MFYIFRKLISQRTTRKAETIQATKAPTTSPSPFTKQYNIAQDGPTEAEPALEVVATPQETPPPPDETTPVEQIQLPPPPPAIAEPPKEVNLYQPSAKEAICANWLEERIIGQPKAIEALVFAYRAYLNPVKNPNRPISVLAFLGPSRTGKTLCAQRLAEHFHGRRDAYIKIDGGDYMDKANLTKLCGASAQWVGYQKPGEKLQEGAMDTSALLSAHNLIASRKGSDTDVTIVLIDEVEKGCPEFLQFFLSIFDVASATMGNNQKVDYSRCIFIMTSNLGTDRVEKELSTPIGIGASKQETLSESRIKALVEKCMKERFAPEFRNRIDMSVIFSHLTDENIRKIADVEIADLEEQLQKSLAERKFQLEIDAKAREFILAEALKGKGNVANLKRVLETHLRGPIGTGLINETIRAGKKVFVTHKESDRLSFWISDDAEVAAVQKENPPELLEAQNLWEQASKDHEANLQDLAISNLRKAIETLEPLRKTQAMRLAMLYNRLGIYYSKKPNHAQEVAAFSKALQYRLLAESTSKDEQLIDPASIYGNLGLTYFQMKENDKARAVYEEGLSYLAKQPWSADSYSHLAYFLDAYSALDRSKTAELFTWALKLQATNNKTQQSKTE